MPSESSRTILVRANVLELERTRLAWSVETLAHKAGLSVKTLSRISKGKPTLMSTVQRLADALGVPANTLCAQVRGNSAYFDIRVRTLGLVEDEEQLTQIMTITQELVVKLRNAGISVLSQDSNLSMGSEGIAGKAFVLVVEGMVKPDTGGKVIGILTSNHGVTPRPCWGIVLADERRARELLQQCDDQTFDPESSPIAPGKRLVFSAGFSPSAATLESCRNGESSSTPVKELTQFAKAVEQSAPKPPSPESTAAIFAACAMFGNLLGMMPSPRETPSDKKA